MKEEKARPRAGAGARSSSAQTALVRGDGAVGSSFGVGTSESAALPPVLDLPTVARLLGIGRTNAYRLAASGGLPFPVLRIGTQWRVPTAGVLEVLGIAPAGIGERTEATVHGTSSRRLTWCEFDGSGDV